MAIAKNDIVIRDENYIPSGLKNNSSHYIDTGIQLDNNSRVEIEFKLNSLPTSVMPAYIFGVKGTISGSSVSTALYTNRRNEESTDCVFRASIPGSTANIIGTAELNHIYKVVFDYAEKKVTLDGIISTLVSSLTAWEFPGNAYVFSSNDALAAIKASITLYSMRIYKGGAMVRNYTPKQGESSSGLYDAISETLNTGSGSGSFTFVPVSGELFRFSTNRIDNIETQTAVNIVGEELSIDTLSTTVIDNAKEGTVLVPNDTSGTVLMYNGFLTSDGFILATDVVDAISAIVNIKYGTPIYWEVNNELQGKFYAKKVTRIAKNKYKLDAISAIGLLDKIPHQGGVYRNETFSRLLADIMAREPSNRRLPLSLYELDYITKDSTTTTLVPGYAQNNIECVVTVTLPSTISGKMTLFGVNDGTYYYALHVTSSRTTNQYNYGTNLQFDFATLHDSWQGSNHNLPYLQPGTTHRIGFRGSVQYDEIRQVNYYHLDLFCDGVLYEGSMPGYGVWSVSGKFLNLLAYNNNGTVQNVMGGARLLRYEIWENGEKKDDVVFCNKYDAPGQIFEFDFTTGAEPYSPISGFTAGPQRDIGDQTPIIPYVIEQPTLARMPVSGFLPQDSKRANLYQLLFATNANLVKDADGSLIFKWLDNNNAKEIVDANIYMEGQVEYPAEVSEVAVTEHQFYGSDGEIKTLFDTEETVTHKQVYFSDAPIYVPSVEASSGLSLEYCTPTYAIVSGIGRLTGCRYLHNETVNSATNPDAFEGKVVEVKDATLITSATSNNVRDRLMQFYKNGKKVRNAIKFIGQTAGRPYTLHNSYNEYVEGMLEKLEINISGINKAEAEFCVGYQPNGSGGIYTRTQVLSSGSGTFTFPEGITSAKVVLIGGGDGGSSGEKGIGGGIGHKYDQYGTGLSQTGGKGGKGGKAGNSGKVFSFDLNAGLTHSFQYSIGVGGVGGASPSQPSISNPGSPGTATTFKDLTTLEIWSSANGGSAVYINPLTGIKYGLPGEDGIAGGDGGSSYGFTTGTQPYNTARPGQSTVDAINIEYAGGLGGSEQRADTAFPSEGIYNVKFTACGGSGGGAAVGANGNNGTNGWQEGIWYYDDFTIYGGDGGNGANAPDRSETPLVGQGGYGGHGGGGGGQGGDAWANPSKDSYVAIEGQGGYGGNGGKGGTGGSGCIIILY